MLEWILAWLLSLAMPPLQAPDVASPPAAVRESEQEPLVDPGGAPLADPDWATASDDADRGPEIDPVGYKSPATATDNADLGTEFDPLG